MGEIRKTNLHESLIEYMQTLGLTEEQIKEYIENRMVLDGLSTESKDLVGAINELFQNANNGKELIASAIGEPLTSEDTFSAMSDKIHEIKGTLANALRNNGIVITGEESFEELISMVEVKNGIIIELENIKQVDCGNGFICILTNDNILWGCGNNDYGQLGLGDTTNRSTFTQINNDVKQVVCGASHTFILKNDGSVWSCGLNDRGQLGLGDNTNRNKFTQVTTNINNINRICCGTSFVYILKNDGSVWSCGNNSNGQLGLGNTTNRTTFTQVTTNINNDVEQIACGGYHTIILKNDGSVWSCGNNSQGQLGINSTSDKSTFTQVTTNINNDVKQIACGGFYDGNTSPYTFGHTIILKNDGSVWGCGYNTWGQLGLGNNTNKSIFTQITTNVNNDIKKVICYGNNTVMLKNNGSVWTCGNNSSGQLGLGTTNSAANTKLTQVTTNINNDVSDIVCGKAGSYECILKNDGTIWACGVNTYGQFGLGDTTSKSTFVRIFKQILINIW